MSEDNTPVGGSVTSGDNAEAIHEAHAAMIDAVDHLRRLDPRCGRPGVVVWARVSECPTSPEFIISTPEFPIGGIASDDPRVPAVVAMVSEEKRRRLLDLAAIRIRLRRRRPEES
jgi:hypothetical protein